MMPLPENSSGRPIYLAGRGREAKGVFWHCQAGRADMVIRNRARLVA